MTHEEWNELRCIDMAMTIMPILNEKSDRDVLRRIALEQDELRKFIDDNKPFEVEVDMKYVSRFDILITIGNSGSDWKISKNDYVSIYSYDRDSVTAIHDGVYFSMGLDQFKACFKPIEEE